MRDFLQLLVQGTATGATYALIALAFSIVYQTSRVLNFAQGGLLLAGTYLTSYGATALGVPFPVALLGSCAVIALVAVGFYAGAIRPTTGAHDFVPIMSSLGFGILLVAAVELVFGPDQRALGDPWGSSAVEIGGVSVLQVKLWAIGLAALTVAGVFVLARRSSYGLAIRALAIDEEAAASLGVPVARVHAVAWAAAGVLGCLAGVLLAAFPSSPNLTLSEAALRAFPAVVLGGLTSAHGAVVGSLVIGVVESLAAGYAPSWTGANVHAVVPYLVMMVILLVRPHGLFGQARVVRA